MENKKLMSEQICKIRKMMGLAESYDVYDHNGVIGASGGVDEEVGDGGFPVDPTYTHFAMDKSNGKIVNGWEYDPETDVESVREYCKNDLRDLFPDRKPSEFLILTRKGCVRKGIDPFDWGNWGNTGTENGEN